MICNIFGKSVTVKILFIYINHENRRLSEKALIFVSTNLADFFVLPLPLSSQNPLSWSETFCWHP